MLPWRHLFAGIIRTHQGNIVFLRFKQYYLNPLQSTSDNSYGTIGKWKLAWQQRAFRNQLIVFVVIFLGVLIAFPHFFSFIESRRGYEIADPLLYRIPAIDLSPITFSIIWLMSLFLFIRMIQSPALAIQGVIAINLIFLTRMITIIVLPLEPPPGLIELKDPISNYFYGDQHGFITRDLFFSGHTSTMIMIGLLLPGKWEKWVAFSAAVAVGCLVLIQHIHYSIDVIGAWVFTWFLYKLAKAIAVDPQKASPN